MAYTILAGRFPYGDELEVGVEQVVDNLVAGRVEDLQKYNDTINDKLALLIHKLIQVKPYKRFRNADTILQKLYEIKDAVA